MTKLLNRIRTAMSPEARRRVFESDFGERPRASFNRLAAVVVDNVCRAVGIYVQAVVNDEWPETHHGQDNAFAKNGLKASSSRFGRSSRDHTRQRHSFVIAYQSFSTRTPTSDERQTLSRRS